MGDEVIEEERLEKIDVATAVRMRKEAKAPQPGDGDGQKEEYESRSGQGEGGKERRGSEWPGTLTMRRATLMWSNVLRRYDRALV